MKINQKKTVQVDVTELRLHIKVRDSFNAGVFDSEGEAVGEYEGYVPGFFPGEHYGDYLQLHINIETGQITNWRKPNAEQLEALLSGEVGDD